MAGPTRIVQSSFGRGMFRSLTPELIPSDACYDITNGLLTNDGAIVKRGGSRAFSANDVDPQSTHIIWAGKFNGTPQIVLDAGVNLWNMVNPVMGNALVNTGNPHLLTGIDHQLAYQDGNLVGTGGSWNGTGPGPWSGGQLTTFCANRLVRASNARPRVTFSNIGDPTTFDATDYVDISDCSEIRGLFGYRDATMIFTDTGISVLGNMAFNLTDDAGNVQMSLDRYSHDVVLVNDLGVAGYAGALVVPATDGIWLVSLGLQGEAPARFERISDNIDLYYKALTNNIVTYQAPLPVGPFPFGPLKVGQATVYRGHYILPVHDGIFGSGGTILVCKLDATDSRGNPTYPWTQMSNGIAQPSLGGFVTGGVVGVVTGPTSTGDKLFGFLETGRIVQLDWFDDSGVPSPTDFFWDGSVNDYVQRVPDLSVTTRDYTTGSLVKNTVNKTRVRYELAGVTGQTAPTITGTVYNPTTMVYDTLTGTAPVDPGGEIPFAWHVGKKREFVRFVFTIPLQTARAIIRSIEVFVRDAGKL